MRRLLAAIAPLCIVPTASAETGAAIAKRVNLQALNTTQGAFEPGQTAFTVKVAGLPVSLSRFFALALPGEVVEFEVMARPGAAFAFAAPGIEDALVGERSIAFAAPAEAGAYPVAITSPEGEAMTVTVFVLTPLSETVDGRLEGYRVGDYPQEPLRGLDSYLPPEGLIRMPPALYDHPLSPHFRLGQFVSKQGGDPDTHFLLVRPEIVLKLEALLRQVNADGVRADSFYVMSGYRTPAYNADLGNVPYSRHQWGDATDIYVDRNEDMMMDDIDGDGRTLRRDAGRLFEYAEEVDGLEEFVGVRGGIGEYGANSAHGPFVHVDTRGTPARWGR